MTEFEFRELLNRLAKGWASRDYAQVAEAFAEDVCYADPLRYSFHNRASLRAFFEADEGREQSTVFHTVIFDEARQVASVEYTYEGSHRYHGVALIRLENGRITHWREYQHIDPRAWPEFVAGTEFPPAHSDGLRVFPKKFAHTNLIAKDWKRLSTFFQVVFGCVPVPPERDLSGEWLDKATGVIGSHISGVHLRLPGYGEDGPTLEIFQYGSMSEHPPVHPNTPGFSHIAFAVDDVLATAGEVLNNGGSAVGEITFREVAGVGLLTFQHVADPEGNIIEIQKWSHSESIPAK